MYSLYPVTMDTETLDTEAMNRQSVEKLSTDTQVKDRQSVEGNSMDRQMVDEEQTVIAEPGITVVSVITVQPLHLLRWLKTVSSTFQDSFITTLYWLMPKS